jgi:hypothetical protein
MAAVLAAGPHAALSHRAAGAVWGVHPSRYLEVTAVNERRRPGIRMHRAWLPPDEVTSARGIPATTITRTLFDLAAVLRPRHLERAINEAEAQRPSDPLSLPHLIARYPQHRGVRTLKEILDQGTGTTRSELEVRFLEFIDAHRLPRPETNSHLLIRGAWIECDCLWREQGLVVELDGRAWHSTADAFERDRERDRAVNAEGFRTVRVTWRQLHESPEALALDLSDLLSPRSSRPR